jgi:cytochrome c oxidase subunit II
VRGQRSTERGRRHPAIAAAIPGAVLVASAGCSGAQGALNPGGPHAHSIATLWWVMLGLAIVVLAGLFIPIGWALFRRRDVPLNEHGIVAHDDEVAAADRGALSSRGMAQAVVWGGAGIPAVLLLILLVFSVAVSRQTSEPPPDGALVVEVTGRQFWWDVRYQSDRPAEIFRTANELRIPVGRPVVVRLLSADVIHSFWVPRLHGKLDMVPGRQHELVIQADSVGVFRGQCAEFCGVQHAKMAFYVVAMPEPEFEAWRRAQIAPAMPPADSLRIAGEAVFLSAGCAACHSVRGTMALAKVGPDLTHFGSRLSIAAGTLPNRTGHLGGWLADPQRIKPGNFMPAIPLDGPSLRALVAYLEGLL